MGAWRSSHCPTRGKPRHVGWRGVCLAAKLRHVQPGLGALHLQLLAFVQQPGGIATNVHHLSGNHQPQESTSIAVCTKQHEHHIECIGRAEPAEDVANTYPPGAHSPMHLRRHSRCHRQPSGHAVREPASAQTLRPHPPGRRGMVWATPAPACARGAA